MSRTSKNDKPLVKHLCDSYAVVCYGKYSYMFAADKFWLMHKNFRRGNCPITHKGCIRYCATWNHSKCNYWNIKDLNWWKRNKEMADKLTEKVV